MSTLQSFTETLNANSARVAAEAAFLTSPSAPVSIPVVVLPPTQQLPETQPSLSPPRSSPLADLALLAAEARHASAKRKRSYAPHPAVVDLAVSSSSSSEEEEETEEDRLFVADSSEEEDSDYEPRDSWYYDDRDIRLLSMHPNLGVLAAGSTACMRVILEESGPSLHRDASGFFLHPTPLGEMPRVLSGRNDHCKHMAVGRGCCDFCRCIQSEMIDLALAARDRRRQAILDADSSSD